METNGFVLEVDHPRGNRKAYGVASRTEAQLTTIPITDLPAIQQASSSLQQHRQTSVQWIRRQCRTSHALFQWYPRTDLTFLRWFLRTRIRLRPGKLWISSSSPLATTTQSIDLSVCCSIGSHTSIVYVQLQLHYWFVGSRLWSPSLIRSRTIDRCGISWLHQCYVLSEQLRVGILQTGIWKIADRREWIEYRWYLLSSARSSSDPFVRQNIVGDHRQDRRTDKCTQRSCSFHSIVQIHYQSSRCFGP